MDATNSKILDGRQTAKILQDQIALQTLEFKKTYNKTPHLAAVLIGEDGASHTYINAKIKACKRIGFNSSLIQRKADISEKELIEIIEKLNKNEEIDGYIVQLPLPKHINTAKINDLIDPKKDVDGFHPVNVGKIALSQQAFVSATPQGILNLLLHYNISTTGKHVVVVGRSNIVGRPISILLSSPAKENKPGDATVTVCNSHTQDLAKYTKMADILIAAVGKPDFISGNMIKKDAVVIDVGTTRVKAKSAKKGYRVKGDINFEEALKVVSKITPVPGGIGPMTITSLLQNTLLAAKKHCTTKQSSLVNNE